MAELPWHPRFLTPFLARQVARELRKKNPGLPPEEIASLMRRELGHAPSAEESRLIDAAVSRLQGAAAPQVTPPRPLSAWVLVGANALPLVGVVFWGWDAFMLLMIFCMENVIIGVLNLARMPSVPGDWRRWLAKPFVMLLFSAHYGGFAAGHAAIVLKVLGEKDPARNILEWVMRTPQDAALFLTLGVLAASHVFSFLWNYLYRGEFRGAQLSELFVKPYGRVLLMHVALLLGGFIAHLLGSPLLVLMLLVAMKTRLDFNAHVKEHSVANPLAPANVRFAR